MSGRPKPDAAGQVPGPEAHQAHQVSADPVEDPGRDDQLTAGEQVPQPPGGRGRAGLGGRLVRGHQVTFFSRSWLPSWLTGLVRPMLEGLSAAGAVPRGTRHRGLVRAAADA